MVVSLRNVSTVNQSLLRTLSDKIHLSTSLVQTTNSNVVIFDNRLDGLTSTVNQLDDNVNEVLEKLKSYPDVGSNKVLIEGLQSNVSSNIDAILALENFVNSNIDHILSNQSSITELRSYVDTEIATAVDGIETRLDTNDIRVSTIEDNVQSNVDSILVLEQNVASNLEFIDQNIADISLLQKTGSNVKYNEASTTLEVKHSGSEAYTFEPQYTGNNPSLSIMSGLTIAFNLDGVQGHPFCIKNSDDSLFSTGLLHADNLGNVKLDRDAQRNDSGILYWRVPESASGTYTYQCGNHSNMQGVINVIRNNDILSTLDAQSNNISTNSSNIEELNDYLRLLDFDFEKSNVGVNKEAPTESLDVVGKIKVSDGIINGGDYLAQSDQRLKTDIEKVNDPFTLVQNISGYTFVLKKDVQKKRRIGLLAQEVLVDLPEAVDQDDEGIYSIAYGNLVGVLVEAVKDLNTRLQSMEEKWEKYNSLI